MKKEDYMRLPKERLAELLEERDNQPVVPIVLSGNYEPKCYEKDGVCTNPQMDCVNCPKKHLYGGNGWTSSLNNNVK